MIFFLNKNCVDFFYLCPICKKIMRFTFIIKLLSRRRFSKKKKIDFEFIELFLVYSAILHNFSRQVNSI